LNEFKENSNKWLSEIQKTKEHMKKEFDKHRIPRKNQFEILEMKISIAEIKKIS
jgi:hypothetical protein